MSMSFSVTSEGVSKTRNLLRRMIGRAPLGAAEVSNQFARLTQSFVKMHASGRPGPQIITGEYFDSIRVSQLAEPGLTATAVVGTDAPQAARLEFGFVGVDSLGRHYHQPPFPHWIPGMYEAAQHVQGMRNVFVDVVVG